MPMPPPTFDPDDEVRSRAPGAPSAEDGGAALRRADARAEVDLDCDECGARLSWSPGRRALECAHCGTAREVLTRDRLIVERPLEAEAVRAASTGYGLELRVLACETCGARTALEGSVTSDRCPFCASARVLAAEASRNALRPESLIPLAVDRERVEAAFRKWLRRLWFRPNALQKQREFSALGLYVPAWTFDAHADSRWTAQSGTYYWDTESYTALVDGRPVRRTRRVRKVRWRPAWGSRSDAFDDLEVLASRGVDAALAEELGSFDTRELVPYSPEYLAGWRAEEYELDLEGAWHRARERMEAEQRSRCARDVPGDTHRALSVETTLTGVHWKHVLLPLWSLVYVYRGKPYVVLVHGQSGRVAGRAPLSWIKIASAVAVLALVALAVALLAGR